MSKNTETMAPDVVIFLKMQNERTIIEKRLQNSLIESKLENV